MITGSISRKRIDPKHVVKKIDKDGVEQQYINFALMENKAGPDQYGNDGFVVQSVSKEAYAAGEKGPIIGNWKRMAPKAQSAPPPKPAAAPADEAIDDVPF